MNKARWHYAAQSRLRGFNDNEILHHDPEGLDYFQIKALLTHQNHIICANNHYYHLDTYPENSLDQLAQGYVQMLNEILEHFEFRTFNDDAILFAMINNNDNNKTSIKNSNNTSSNVIHASSEHADDTKNIDNSTTSNIGNILDINDTDNKEAKVRFDDLNSSTSKIGNALDTNDTDNTDAKEKFDDLNNSTSNIGNILDTNNIDIGHIVNVLNSSTSNIVNVLDTNNTDNKEVEEKFDDLNLDLDSFKDEKSFGKFNEIKKEMKNKVDALIKDKNQILNELNRMKANFKKPAVYSSYSAKLNSLEKENEKLQKEKKKIEREKIAIQQERDSLKEKLKEYEDV
jgi:predicted nuclease with TOPRIM domain